MSITLKAARVNKGLTQKEAAVSLEISEATLFSYEKGRTFPPQNVIVRIEKLYEVSYNNINFLPKING